MVQHEIERRGKGKKYHSGVHPFSTKIKCGECGCWYGSKVWHSNSKYRRMIWRCNHKYDGDQTCKTPHLTDEEIQAAFLRAANNLLETKAEVVKNGYAIPAEDFWPRNAMYDSTPHKVYDAGLIKNANLHRFLNKAGEPYSAIYVGRDERLSCERGHEQGMIDYWNQG